MKDEIEIGRARIKVRQGDIVRAGTEAIVNAANSDLASGGGVDGAIHRAAGPELFDLTRPFGGCPTGSAVITGAGRIAPPTRFIIHAVGPIFEPLDEQTSAALLTSVYRESMRLCEESGVASVAFPSISTGVFGYPIWKAAPVALDAIVQSLRAMPEGAPLRLVVFTLFSPADRDVYGSLLDELASNA